MPTRESLDKGGEKKFGFKDAKDAWPPSFGPDGLTKDSELNPWTTILGGGKIVNFNAEVA